MSAQYLSKAALSISVPVRGNGISLGLTNGTIYGGLLCWYQQNIGPLLGLGGNHYGDTIGKEYTINNNTTRTVYGITLDGSKSGMVADMDGAFDKLEACLYLKY